VLPYDGCGLEPSIEKCCVRSEPTQWLRVESKLFINLLNGKLDGENWLSQLDSSRSMFREHRLTSAMAGMLAGVDGRRERDA